MEPVVSVKGNREPVRENRLDRVIGWLAPQFGLRRLQARVARQVFNLSGGYTGIPTRKRVLGQWSLTDGDADADILGDLDELRNASRDLERNNPIAAGGISTKVTAAIGAGLRLSAVVDREALGMDDDEADALERQLEREFDLFACGVECDWERIQNFAELTRTVYRAVKHSGDVFAILPMRERTGSPYETKVQVIEADRVSNPKWRQDSDTIAGGIERTEDGQFRAIHVLNRHPGTSKTRTSRNKGLYKWRRIEAFGRVSGRRNVLHVFDKRRPGQSRGVPDLAPVMSVIKQLGRYTEAEVDAAVISAFFTVFVKSEGTTTLAPMQPTGDTGASASDQDIKLASGAIVGLSPGEDIETANPGRPNDSFDPFVQALFVQIGMALEIPYELLVKQFKSSYSASRAAINEFWRYVVTERAMMRDRFCQPVYEAVVEEAVLKGRISAPGFFADPAIRRAYTGARWIGPGRGQINELGEVQASAERVNQNFSTKAEETAALTGNDYEATARTRRREVESEKRLGIEPRDKQGKPVMEDDPDGRNPDL